MIPLTWKALMANRGGSYAGCRRGLSDVATCMRGKLRRWRRVITAGSGDTYRIERVNMDGDEAYRFEEEYNGTAPVEPVHVEEWETGAPPKSYDGPYWRAQWWARVPVSKRSSELRHTRDGERRDDFGIRQEWWTGEAVPDAKVVRRELAGIPRVEVVGLSKDKWRNCLGHDYPGQSRSGGSATEVVAIPLRVG